MTASAEDPLPGEPRDEGWDETVLVWNATVAQIRPPAARRDPDADLAGAEAGSATLRRRAGRGSS